MSRNEKVKPDLQEMHFLASLYKTNKKPPLKNHFSKELLGLFMFILEKRAKMAIVGGHRPICSLKIPILDEQYVKNKVGFEIDDKRNPQDILIFFLVFDSIPKIFL